MLVVEGRVWGHDTRRPLAHATLDIWQANAQGRYDNDDPDKPPAAGVFLNRTRLVTDESGFYEFESVHPGRYKIGPNIWRPSHVHYMVSHPGYKTLVTQLYFEGDPMNKSDQFIKPSLIIRVRQVKAGRGTYEAGTFDIVLAQSWTPGGLSRIAAHAAGRSISWRRFFPPMGRTSGQISRLGFTRRRLFPALFLRKLPPLLLLSPGWLVEGPAGGRREIQPSRFLRRACRQSLLDLLRASFCREEVACDSIFSRE